VRERLAERSDCLDELERLDRLERRIATDTPSDAKPAAAGRAVPRFRLCNVCTRVEKEVRGFLEQFQYRITIDRSVRDELARNGGLCPFHTWQYAAIASPQGTCLGFPNTLEERARKLLAIRGGQGPGVAEELRALQPDVRSCVACRTSVDAEGKALADVTAFALRGLDNGLSILPDVCLQHLPDIVSRLPSEATARRFLEAEADSLERVAEDMRRYALKRDGTRRAFTTRDEIDSHARGLVALAGHSALSFVRKPE